jgi:hypothetical protein
MPYVRHGCLGLTKPIYLAVVAELARHFNGACVVFEYKNQKRSVPGIHIS